MASAPGVAIINNLKVDSEAVSSVTTTTTTARQRPGAAILRRVNARLAAVDPQVALFASESAELEEAGASLATELASVLRDADGFTITVGGHTDSAGPAAYNEDLSRQRADAFAAALADAEISRSDLVSVGYGSRRPVDDNSTAAGRARNRRITIDLAPK